MKALPWTLGPVGAHGGHASEGQRYGGVPEEVNSSRELAVTCIRLSLTAWVLPTMLNENLATSEGFTRNASVEGK